MSTLYVHKNKIPPSITEDQLNELVQAGYKAGISKGLLFILEIIQAGVKHEIPNDKLVSLMSSRSYITEQIKDFSEENIIIKPIDSYEKLNSIAKNNAKTHKIISWW